MKRFNLDRHFDEASMMAYCLVSNESGPLLDVQLHWIMIFLVLTASSQDHLEWCCKNPPDEHRQSRLRPRQRIKQLNLPTTSWQMVQQRYAVYSVPSSSFPIFNSNSIQQFLLVSQPGEKSDILESWYKQTRFAQKKPKVARLFKLVLHRYWLGKVRGYPTSGGHGWRLQVSS